MTDEVKILEAVADRIKRVGLSKIVYGQPTSPPPNTTVAIWYAGEFEKTKTLTNVMVTEIVRIRMYWKRAESGQVKALIEGDLWTKSREIQAQLRSDSDLGGNVEDLEIGEATTGYVEISGSMQRILTIDCHVIRLEQEAISG